MWTIEIRDSRNRTVFTADGPPRRRRTPLQLGRHDHERHDAPDGVYTIVITAKDAAGEAIEPTITVRETIMGVDFSGATPLVITPSGTRELDTIRSVLDRLTQTEAPAERRRATRAEALHMPNLLPRAWDAAAMELGHMSIYTALRAGVSGLTANSSALAVISDNIANVNTVGYKRGGVDFSALVNAQNSNTTYNAGGVLPLMRQQISLQGSLEQSRSTTDLAISGEGFFIVSTEQPAARERRQRAVHARRLLHHRRRRLHGERAGPLPAGLAGRQRRQRHLLPHLTLGDRAGEHRRRRRFGRTDRECRPQRQPQFRRRTPMPARKARTTSATWRRARSRRTSKARLKSSTAWVRRARSHSAS